MEERRRIARPKTIKGATIFCDGVGGIDCVVRNLSQVGACLEINGPTRPQSPFSLIIRPETIRRTCQIVWQKGDRIGVKFVQRAHH